MVTAKQVFERLVNDIHVVVYVDRKVEIEFSEKALVPPELLEVSTADWDFGSLSKGAELREAYFVLKFSEENYPLARQKGEVE